MEKRQLMKTLFRVYFYLKKKNPDLNSFYHKIITISNLKNFFDHNWSSVNNYFSKRISGLKIYYWLKNDPESLFKLKKNNIRADLMFLSIYHKILNRFSIQTGFEIRNYFSNEFKNCPDNVRPSKNVSLSVSNYILKFKSKNLYSFGDKTKKIICDHTIASRHFS